MLAADCWLYGQVVFRQHFLEHGQTSYINHALLVS